MPTGGSHIRIGLPLALSEPEPTRPFGLSLSEPTNRHLPYLLIIMHVFSKQVTMKKKRKVNCIKSEINIESSNMVNFV